MILKRSNFPEKLFVNRDGTSVSSSEFWNSISTNEEYLKNISCERVILNLMEPYEFTSALLAALKLGKTIVLLPNQTEGLSKELIQKNDFVYGKSITAHNEQEISCEIKLDEQTEIIFYTSGSSGEPEAIQKTLKLLLNEFKVLEKLIFNSQDSELVIASVSQFHIYGFLFRILAPLLSGKKISNFNIAFEEDLLKCSDLKEKLIFISSPAFLKRLSYDLDLRSIEFIESISSGGLLEYKYAQSYHQLTGHYCMEIYGSTETGGIAYRRQKNDGHSWTFLPEVKGDKDKRDCLVVSSPFISEKFITNDKVEFTSDKTFKLLGRVDRVYKIAEKRVSLVEIEKRLKNFPEVDEAFCTILKEREREFLGCLIVPTSRYAFKKKIDGVKFFQQKLRAYFDSTLIPKKFLFLEQLPYNSQSKLRDSDVKRLFNE